jgi:hypothetical protein
VEASLTIGEGPESHFMVIGTRSEWLEILNNLDGVGHSPATLRLIAELKRWGMHK